MRRLHLAFGEMGRSGQIRSLKSLRSAKERPREFCIFPFLVVALTTCNRTWTACRYFAQEKRSICFFGVAADQGTYVLGWATGNVSHHARCGILVLTV